MPMLVNSQLPSGAQVEQPLPEMVCALSYICGEHFQGLDLCCQLYLHHSQ